MIKTKHSRRSFSTIKSVTYSEFYRISVSTNFASNHNITVLVQVAFCVILINATFELFTYFYIIFYPCHPIIPALVAPFLRHLDGRC